MKKSMFLFFCTLVAMPMFAFAASGKNIANTSIDVYTNQGGKWFVARRVKSNKNSFVKIADVLPGKYEFRINSKDVRAGQFLAVELQMRDNQGKILRKKTNVDVYVHTDAMPTLLATTATTNKSGKLTLNGITPNTVFELVVRDSGSVKKDGSLARIKTKAKVSGSDWFDSNYSQLTLDASKKTNGVLEVTNVLPGRYKFKVKNSDPYDATKPFTVKAQMLDKNGKQIKKATNVKIYSDADKSRKLVAELKTDADGWVTLPAVQPGVAYRIKVGSSK